MKKYIKIILLLVVVILLDGCKKGYLGLAGVKLGGGGSNSNLEYYQGAIPNSFYTENWDGTRNTTYGKPFLVMKYDRTTHDVIDFEFGLSEAYTVGKIGFPTLSATGLDATKKLGLKSPVALLVDWPRTAWGLGVLKNGKLGTGGGAFFSMSYAGTLFSFSYLPAGSMTGGAENLYGDGIATEATNSFNMSKQ